MGYSMQGLFTDPAEIFLLCNRENLMRRFWTTVIGQRGKIMSSFLFKWKKERNKTSSI